MRVFKKYAPVQIARHVVLFFKGRFSIQGMGEFVFDHGKVVVSDSDKVNFLRLKICHEVNKAVYNMTGYLRAGSPARLCP